MARLLPRPHLLFLICSSIFLAGCQHPMGPSAADRPSTAHPFIDARNFPATANPVETCVVKVSLEKVPDPKNDSLVAAQKEPECSTVQLGDDFAHLLKILKDH